VQQVKAGLKSIYLSGWQVAADANLSGQTYPDQSLYPANSVPSVVRRLNQALLRADQIERAEGGEASREWLVRSWPTRRRASVVRSMRSS
jgi:isocitrate lyase